MDMLIKESESLALPCFDLVPARSGDPVVAYWGGRRSDLPEGFPAFVAALKSQRHVLSVDQSLYDQLGLCGRYPLALSVVTTAEGDERPDALNVSTGRIGEVTFEDSIPLTAKPAVSLPPLEALLLYGPPAIQDWLAAQGIKRWEYAKVQAEIRDEYTRFFNPTLPLCMVAPPFARIGGWHILWPEDDYYTPREMRLMAWTFQDSEPWYEAFLSPLKNYVLRSRST